MTKGKKGKGKNVNAPTNPSVVGSNLSKSARRRLRKKIKQDLISQAGLFAGEGMQAGGPRRPRWDFGWSGGSIPIPGMGVVSPGNITLSGRSRRDPEMVGLAEHTDDIQVVMPRVETFQGGPFGTFDLIAGTEFLLPVSNEGSGANPGDILATILINPSLFSGTRLFQFAQLYERYRFRKLEFWYKAAANATQSGQLIGFGDYDPANTLNFNSEENLQIAAAHLGQRSCKIWESKSFPFGVVDNYTTLFVDTAGSEDLRLSIQGVYYLLAATTIASSITTLGNIYCKYELEAYIPVLQTAQAAAVPPLLMLLSSSSGRTEGLPLGNAPSVSPAGSFQYPPSNLGFEINNDLFDVFYETSNGSVNINSTNAGDVWEITEVVAGHVAQTSAPLQMYSNLTAQNAALEGVFDNTSFGFPAASATGATAGTLSFQTTTTWTAVTGEILAPLQITPSLVAVGATAGWVLSSYTMILKRLQIGRPAKMSHLERAELMEKFSLKRQRQQTSFRRKAEKGRELGMFDNLETKEEVDRFCGPHEGMQKHDYQSHSVPRHCEETHLHGRQALIRESGGIRPSRYLGPV